MIYLIKSQLFSLSIDQPLPLVDPQRLRVQPRQLGRDRDAEQPPVQVRPPGTHHDRRLPPARYRTASSARAASLTISSSAVRVPAGDDGGMPTQTGPARSGGSAARPADRTVTGTPTPPRDRPAGAPAAGPCGLAASRPVSDRS